MSKPETAENPAAHEATEDGLFLHDRPGHEYIDGQWVPKHRDEPRSDIEEDRPGSEFIDGVWV